MAKKISQLTQATEVKSDDVTVIVQDGETKKLPLNLMVTKQDIENKKIAGLAKLDEIEATYENDTYTPTITVKNKSSVKTGEGDEVDYSANVMDGHVKSAILSGNTLVNLMTNCKDEYVVTYNAANNPNNNVANISMMKPNTEYTLFYKAKYRTEGDGSGTNGSLKIATSIEQGFIFTDQSLTTEYKQYVYRFTTSSVVDCFVFSTTDKYFAIKECVLLEGDYTQEDIPYFEGMQSVKMPVLKTIGKNLFDGQFIDGKAISFTTGNYYDNNHMTSFVNFIEVKPSTKYRINISDAWFVEYNSNKQCIGGRQFWDYFTTSSDCRYVKIYMSLNLKSDTLQIEEGTVATPYEPYKSNILTVNEEVELRGIGDVKDTLDLTTGELTERIGYADINSFVAPPSYRALSDNQGYMAVIGLENKKQHTTNLISNLVKVSSINNADFGMYNNPANIVVFRKNCTLDELKSIINQIQIVYELETPVIKTVDLMPSGTHPSTTPYCWKNGHIQLSSSGLLPNLEYSVVTSRAGQINQNATMIVKNDKRIFDLEILLAGGLVNTTYQALTLQNQVETGLSKVSLNSEKEPDYLLYHMIMKLIEEKAYKLDDLTEKVSVFYLYEKLSDEQFETIYSALYPFVEDEIIEEPVVEELPEVVEDEVIM